MELAELEVLSVAANQTIVRPPGRAYPGVVIQGDSLSLLARAALRVLATLKEAGADEETLEAAGLLASGLGGRLLHYQDVLARHGIELPYGDPLTAEEVPMEGEE